MSFMLPIDMLEPDIRFAVERAVEGAKASGTPFISFFTPSDMLALAREAGSKRVEHVSAATLAERWQRLRDQPFDFASASGSA